MSDLSGRVAARLRDVPDFPKPGILFKDLTPLLADGPLFAEVAHAIADEHAGSGFDVVAGVEARGFLFGAAVALVAGTGVVPVRKAGKLPWRTVTAAYELEYGEAVVEVHEDAFAEHRRVLLVDDVLATGGTLAAAADLVGRAGGRARRGVRRGGADRAGRARPGGSPRRADRARRVADRHRAVAPIGGPGRGTCPEAGGPRTLGEVSSATEGERL